MFGNDERDKRIKELERKVMNLEYELRSQTNMFGDDIRLRDVMHEVMTHLGIRIKQDEATPRRVYFVHAEAKTKKSK